MLNLLYITWDVDPILLHFGDGGIRWYGLLWAIGLYLCYLVQVRLYKHENCPEDWADKIFLWMALGVIIGARIGHCWFYEWHDVTLPWMANYCRAMNISTEPIQLLMIWILDRLCIGVGITATLIRLGNLMNSEIYGGPTDLPWGFIFVRDGQTVPCHPTQIYEMLYCIVALITTQAMYHYGKAYRREGLLLGTFLLIVFVTRFLLEFIKNDQEAFEAGHLLNMGQLLSIPFILLAGWLVVRAFRRPMNPDTATN